MDIVTISADQHVSSQMFIHAFHYVEGVPPWFSAFKVIYGPNRSINDRASSLFLLIACSVAIQLTGFQCQTTLNFTVWPRWHTNSGSNKMCCCCQHNKTSGDIFTRIKKMNRHHNNLLKLVTENNRWTCSEESLVFTLMTVILLVC